MNTHTNNLKNYRIKQKLTHAQLGELAGISRQTIVLIEENHYSPSVRLAAKFANIFNTTIDSLFTHTLEEEN
ncbi:helix-turn-helix transcriptional regulator [Eubacterium maltosivorans]|uniref:Transcriptional regulator n=1 Tax=Eubacterium maltosivorans TaxID=2041044 RepID=A0A4V1GLK8_EUBML|nr:helix-turn-helix transcriptional regulator [Eubacterium maltosivorans]QCT70136.1 transcriptional regulator [Eubacterium maltosivorans]